MDAPGQSYIIRSAHHPTLRRRVHLVDWVSMRITFDVQEEALLRGIEGALICRGCVMNPVVCSGPSGSMTLFDPNHEFSCTSARATVWLDDSQIVRARLGQPVKEPT